MGNDLVITMLLPIYLVFVLSALCISVFEREQ